MTEAILSVSALSHKFGRRTVIDDISLKVEKGEFRAIIGPNGAGKTTFFNLLTGALACRHGEITFRNSRISNLSAHERCRLGVGRTFQISNVFPNATVAQNIQIPLLARERRNWQLLSRACRMLRDEAEELAGMVGLSASMNKVASALPYGDRRRLELAIALAWRPALLLLDEPACGVSLQERPALMNLVRSIVRDRGMTAILVEHDMDIVFSMADRISVLHRGQLIAEDAPERILKNKEVQDVYLGGRHDG
ncbi:MAG TPA: ABC transporter ATP-binding protein [Ferrovibrio sp.]|uniref:ABC transporter ATP-binding protein n=1 Tax=Ferrovibrio sp. TaxID=1917215 RepID=UPI002ED68060